jgi:hypothetical protein
MAIWDVRSNGKLVRNRVERAACLGTLSIMNQLEEQRLARRDGSVDLEGE